MPYRRLPNTNQSRLRALQQLVQVGDAVMDLKETTLRSELIFDGTILHLYRDDIRLPGGGKAHREIIRHIGAVCVIPLLDDGRVVMERQYRYPVDEVILEIPAGKLDYKGEDHEQAVLRELEEETGYRAAHYTPLGVMYPTPGCCDEKVYIYLATGLTAAEAHPDADEFLDVERCPLDEMVQKVLAGEITDAKTQIGILKAKMLLDSQKGEA